VRNLLSSALLLGLLAAGPLVANQADFARGVVLDTADGSVVQRLTLPDDVYEWIVRRDLGDLRVFNRDQEEMPYSVRRPAGREEFSAWQSLPLFPLPELEADQAGGMDLRVHLGASGAIISYQGATVDTADARAYLLDASALEQTPTEMKLSWSGEGGAEIVTRIRVETSDDLNSWQTLVADTTIARLTNAGGEVLLDRFELPRRQARYLRITQLEGNRPLAISSAAVRHRRSELPQRRWRTLAGAPVEQGWVFQSGGWFPVDRLKLTTSGNFLITARLFSRRSEEDNWRDRGVRTFYRSSIAGGVVESEPLSIDDGDRFWRVEFEGEGLATPELRVGWLPDELVFLKQGAAPYVLAYGQAGVEARPWPLPELLRKLNGSKPVDLADVPFARALDAEMLGGPDRLVEDPAPVDWRMIVLWAVLLLGVAAVGAMAYRLLRN
jgi:hypothetical protein